MGQFDALMNAANRAIDNAYVLLDTKDTPFNVMYKQYKTLQSLWFRIIEEASDYSNSRLEDLCVDLEIVVQKCEEWIKVNSPSAKKNVQEKKEDND